MDSAEPRRPTLGVIIASTRPGRVGPGVANWFLQVPRDLTEEHGVEAQLVDLAIVGLPPLDEPEPARSGRYRQPHTRRWSRTIQGLDMVVVVTPEYNHGMSGALKNAFDFLYHEWAYKPLAVVSYGNVASGARAALDVRRVATSLGMYCLRPTVALSLRAAMVDGGLRPSEFDAEAARLMVRELLSVSDALRPLRPAAPEASG